MLTEVFFVHILDFLSKSSDVLIQRFQYVLNIFLIRFRKLGAFLIKNLIGQILETLLHLLTHFLLILELRFQFFTQFIIECDLFRPINFQNP